MQKVINSMNVVTAGNKSNQPIVFVHGFPFDNWMWHKQIDFFKSRYFCVSYDIRGLGESYIGDGQYTMEAYSSDLLSIIENLQLTKPVLCGLSMGGYITLRTAERAQELLSGLVLIDTKADADDNKAKLNRSAKINQINIDGIESFIEDFLPPLFADETIKANTKLYNDVMTRSKQNNPQGVKGALLAMMGRTDSGKFLKKIKIPTLLIVGAFDKLTTPQTMRKMSENIKDSDFAIAPRAGHLSPLENHGFVNDVMDGFLKKRIKN